MLRREAGGATASHLLLSPENVAGIAPVCRGRTAGWLVGEGFAAKSRMAGTVIDGGL